jgi:hypothetical protein
VEQIRKRAWKALHSGNAAPPDPASPFAIYAREHDLGLPVTGMVDVQEFVVQGFVGGILVAPEADLNDIGLVDW